MKLNTQTGTFGGREQAGWSRCKRVVLDGFGSDETGALAETEDYEEIKANQSTVAGRMGRMGRMCRSNTVGGREESEGEGKAKGEMEGPQERDERRRGRSAGLYGKRRVALALALTRPQAPGRWLLAAGRSCVALAGHPCGPSCVVRPLMVQAQVVL